MFSHSIFSLKRLKRRAGQSQAGTPAPSHCLSPQGTRQGFPRHPPVPSPCSASSCHRRCPVHSAWHRLLFASFLTQFCCSSPLNRHWGCSQALPVTRGLSHTIPGDPNTGICDIPPRSHVHERRVINTAGPVLALLGAEGKTVLWGSHELLSALQLPQNGAVSAGMGLSVNRRWGCQCRMEL